MTREIFALVILSVGCGSSALPEVSADAADDTVLDAATEIRFPDPDWPTGDPSDSGFDLAGLDAAAAYADEKGAQCLLVIRDGELVYERYFASAEQDTLHKTWSIAKSFSSALVGAAILRGEIGGTDDSIATYVDEWQNTQRESITIEHILSMTSGLDFSLIGDNSWTFFSSDQTEDAIANTAEDEPGTVWNYSNRAVQVLDAVIESATGLDPEEYARQVLWEPIGMGPATHWERDRSGNATMYMSVHATCRDLARLGYLYLHGGRWAGSQIVDPGFVTTSVATSSELNRAYGYLWWVNAGEPAFDATGKEFDGPPIPSAPSDLFSAQGLGQSFIDVVPGTETLYIHVRPAPHDPLSQFVTDPSGTMQKIIEDQRRSIHRELMNLLLSASSN